MTCGGWCWQCPELAGSYRILKRFKLRGRDQRIWKRRVDRNHEILHFPLNYYVHNLKQSKPAQDVMNLFHFLSLSQLLESSCSVRYRPRN